MSNRLDNVIAVGLGIAIAFSVLAHGAVEPWSVFMLRWLIGVLLFFWTAKAWGERQLTLRLPKFVWPMLAWLAVGALQSVAWSDAAGLRHSLSLDVDATRETTLTLFALTVAAVMVANFLTDGPRLRAFAGFLTFFGLALALFAFVQHFTWNGAYYWLRPSSEGAHQPGDLFLFGPYRNHNHFAGYMELLFPLPVALVLSRAVGAYRFLFCFAALVIGMAAVGALSRGGMIALAAEIMFLAAMSLRLRHADTPHLHASPLSRSWRAGIVAVLGLAILGAIVWLAPEAFIERVTRGQLMSENPQIETFYISRGWMWRDAYEIFRAHPILGAGLGAFATAYPIYSLSNGSLALKQAHNDYLQLLAESGVIGGVFAVWFIASVLRAVWRGVAAQERWQAGVALGGGAALVGLMVHSVFDFNLQLPANALLFLTLAALVSHCGMVSDQAKREEVNVEFVLGREAARTVRYEV